MTGRTLSLALMVCLGLSVRPLFAVDLEARGHFKKQQSLQHLDSDDILNDYGPDYSIEHEFDLRGILEGGFDSFDFDLQAEVLALAGEGFEAARRAGSELPLSFSHSGLPSDSGRLFEFTTELLDETDAEAVARLDRFSLGYASEYSVVRVGRQVITWGNGLAFNVMDLFNPFSPVEIDKDYKTGDDMLYLQHLFASGADLQGLVVGRRDRLTRTLASSEASAALKFHMPLDELESEFDLLGTRHYDEWIVGAGGSSTVLDGVFRLDFTFTESETEGWKISWLANYDRSFVILGLNSYFFAEYFRNGFGSSEVDLATLTPGLAERIERGELFTLGRDSLALGARVEAHPLVNLFLTHLANLNDTSSFFQLRAVADITQDFQVITGLNVPIGPGGTEYGGLAFPGSDKFVSVPLSAFLRTSLFF